MLPADLPFNIVRSARRKTWSLQILPEEGLRISVPESYTNEAVERILQRHAPWIERRWRRIKDLPRIKLTQKWTNGEKYFYGGRYWTFRFERSFYPHVREEENDVLQVSAHDFSATAVKRIMDEWVRGETHSFIEQRLPYWSMQFQLKDVPPFRLKNLRRSWGLCRSDRKLTFHAGLARLHSDFFNYVIVHELAHLFEMNHSMRFKALVTSVLPEWRTIVKEYEPKIFS